MKKIKWKKNNFWKNNKRQKGRLKPQEKPCILCYTPDQLAAATRNNYSVSINLDQSILSNKPVLPQITFNPAQFSEIAAKYKEDARQLAEEIEEACKRLSNFLSPVIQSMQQAALTMADFNNNLAASIYAAEQELFISENCRKCKYFHGKNGIVCGVHPRGWNDINCPDFER